MIDRASRGWGVSEDSHWACLLHQNSTVADSRRTTRGEIPNLNEKGSPSNPSNSIHNNTFKSVQPKHFHT